MTKLSSKDKKEVKSTCIMVWGERLLVINKSVKDFIVTLHNTEKNKVFLVKKEVHTNGQWGLIF